jgi:hypothetical protein
MFRPTISDTDERNVAKGITMCSTAELASGMCKCMALFPAKASADFFDCLQ